MSVFVDAGPLVAAALTSDQRSKAAAKLLASVAPLRPFATDHVLVESWHLLRRRAGHGIANRWWFALRETPLSIECVGRADLERAESIAATWADQPFDLVDCTSFAVMERLGCTTAATFDRDFAVYRYGAGRRKAFEILR